MLWQHLGENASFTIEYPQISSHPFSFSQKLPWGDISFIQDCPTRCVHSLYDKVVQNHFPFCPFHYLLLHTALGHEAVHWHLFLLPYPVGSGLGLEIILRVPVGIKYYHSICGGQVHTQTTSSRREQETKILKSQVNMIIIIEPFLKKTLFILCKLHWGFAFGHFFYQEQRKQIYKI